MRTCWENLDQQVIDKSIDDWSDKLKAAVGLNGGTVVRLSGSFVAVYPF